MANRVPLVQAGGEIQQLQSADTLVDPAGNVIGSGQAGAGNLNYNYSSTTASADPGSGIFRLNSLTLSAVTTLYISKTDAFGNDLSSVLPSLSGTKLTIYKTRNPAKFAVYTISTATDNGTWISFVVTYLKSAGSFTNLDPCALQTSIATTPPGVASIEVDFGTTPTMEKAFSITDANIDLGTPILICQSGQAPTGKSADDNDFDVVDFAAAPGSGGMTLYGRSRFGPVVGKFKVNYLIGPSSGATGTDPAQVSNMLFRYRGDSLIGPSGVVDGSNISSWADISGLGNNLGAIGGSFPTLKTNDLNGFNVCANVANSGLILNSSAVVPGDLTKFTLFAVLEFRANGISDFFCWNDGNSSGMRVGLDGGSSGVFHVVIPNVGDFASTLSPTQNVYHYLTIINNSGTWTVYMDGTALTWSGSAPSGAINGSPNGISVMSGRSNGAVAFNGRLAELIGYSKAVSASERLNNLEGYAKTTYGLT